MSTFRMATFAIFYENEKKGFALKRSSIGGKLFEIVLYGMAVISTMLVCVLPFLLTDDPVKQISQILFRLFPFGRGLFEDKGLRVSRTPFKSIFLFGACPDVSVEPCIKFQTFGAHYIWHSNYEQS